MPEIYSNNIAMSGVFRAIIIQSRIQNNIEYYAIYVPSLHGHYIPFSNLQNLHQPLEIDINTGIIATGDDVFDIRIHDYPLAQSCDWGSRISWQQGDCVWIMFENGDIDFPVIIGCLSSITDEGIFSFNENYISSESIVSYATSNTSGSAAQISSKLTDYSNIHGWGYPLIKRTTVPIAGGARHFGAKRKRNDGSYRAHAGIDLIIDAGTAVIAMDDGEVIDIVGAGRFASGEMDIGCLFVRHSNGYCVNYGEISPPTNFSVGDKITKGQHIGKIGRFKSGSAMLHIECYSGESSGNLLTNNGTYLSVPQDSYYRRCDLMDPTFISELPLS